MRVLQSPATAPHNLCDLLLRDVGALIKTCRLISRTFRTLRSRSPLPEEMAHLLDAVELICRAGEARLRPSLRQAGAPATEVFDSGADALIVGFFTLPSTTTAPKILATEVITNLRLFANYIELRARLTAEEALLLGQEKLCHSLINWATDWSICSEALRPATVRARAQAYIADVVPPEPVPA